MKHARAENDLGVVGKIANAAEVEDVPATPVRQAIKDFDAAGIAQNEDNLSSRSSCHLLPAQRLAQRQAKALKKYISSFRQGESPPCRSYRALIMLDEFDALFEAFDISKNQVVVFSWSLHLKLHFRLGTVLRHHLSRSINQFCYSLLYLIFHSEASPVVSN